MIEPPGFLAREHPELRLGPGTDLGGSTRSRVSRHDVLAGASVWGSSVVVKQFLPQPEGVEGTAGYARELSGLRHLSGVPRLLAHDPVSETLVMQDLGGAPTLADLLLVPGARRARAACEAWAQALGEHVNPDPRVARAVRRELAGHVADDLVLSSQSQLALDRLQGLGLPGVPAAREELHAALGMLAQRRWHVVSSGDTCPDNAVITPDGVRFLDLEGTWVHHVALDAAYAVLPFATCWCVLRGPADLAATMGDRFTRGLATRMPRLAGDPRWPGMVRRASGVYVVFATELLWPGAWEGGRSVHPGTPLAPSHRQLLLARWRWAAESLRDDMPATAALGERVLAWGIGTWSAKEQESGRGLDLATYPAWEEPE